VIKCSQVQDFFELSMVLLSLLLSYCFYLSSYSHFFVLRTLFVNTVLLFFTNVVSILLKLLSNRWLELKALQDP
jgi:hypothetical protein